MGDAAAEKIARNNSAFRDANDGIDTIAYREGLADGRPVPFICECSDPRCTVIISLTLPEYRRVRRNPRWFAHADGHETDVPGVVQPVERHDRYVIVEKIGAAGEIAARLAKGLDA
jgi:hypothetical protein